MTMRQPARASRLGSARLCSALAGYIYRKERGEQVAHRVSVTYACDYDDKEIAEGQQRNITFGIDGQEYEIDLCARHSARLSEAVGKFTEHARKATVRGAKRRRRTTANRQRSAQIRAWAKKSGIAVSDRGRIPGHVLAGFESSQNQG
jgi:hypothetical protein